MVRPRLLDLFCGAGGASVGYARAGFDVTGVDIVARRGYPFRFVKADALTFDVSGFDVIHASPPCQAFSSTGHLARSQGNEASDVDLIEPTRALLQSAGVPYVIENVPGAPLMNPVQLCGSAFVGLHVRRHRLFESDVLLFGTECYHWQAARPVGVYGSLGDQVPNGGRTAASVAEAQAAMGWACESWTGLRLAIPPAYTHYLGEQLLAQL